MHIEIEINGKTYPCRPTMGAMLRFKKETGKELTEMTDGNLSEFTTYLWCCIVSACKHDGIPFEMSLMDFADSISANDLEKWTEQLQGTEVEAYEDEKKST